MMQMKRISIGFEDISTCHSKVTTNPHTMSGRVLKEYKLFLKRTHKGDGGFLRGSNVLRVGPAAQPCSLMSAPTLHYRFKSQVVEQFWLSTIPIHSEARFMYGHTRTSSCIIFSVAGTMMALHGRHPLNCGEVPAYWSIITQFTNENTWNSAGDQWQFTLDEGNCQQMTKHVDTRPYRLIKQNLVCMALYMDSSKSLQRHSEIRNATPSLTPIPFVTSYVQVITNFKDRRW
jgi:hypothetical protein